jgi:hypothetical protein
MRRRVLAACKSTIKVATDDDLAREILGRLFLSAQASNEFGAPTETEHGGDERAQKHA